MKLKIKWSSPTLLLIYFICVFLVYVPYQATKAEHVDNQTIDISLGSTNSLFEVTNLAPGDVIVSTIKVINSGNDDFHYFMSSIAQDDGELLFRALEVEIKDSHHLVLYQGMLSELEQYSLGDMLGLEKETLTISVSLPRGAGNDLQGQETQFSFHFLAHQSTEGILLPEEEVPGGIPIIKIPGEETPSDKPGALPRTASPWFNLLLIGSLLVICSGVVWWSIRRKNASGS